MKTFNAIVVVVTVLTIYIIIFISLFNTCINRMTTQYAHLIMRGVMNSEAQEKILLVFEKQVIVILNQISFIT